jgi:hypothetical protein
VPVCVSCIVITHVRGEHHELLELPSGRETTYGNVSKMLPAAWSTSQLLADNIRRHQEVRYLFSASHSPV